MSKKWETISRNATREAMTKAERAKQAKVAARLMSKLPTKKEADLKREGNLAFEAQKAQEESLIAAYTEKKLKSKALIEKAEMLIQERENKQNKQAKKADK